MAAVAVVGLGAMGLPMARSLVRAGHDVVAYDRSHAAMLAARAAGIVAEGSAAEAASGADIVVTALPGPAEVRAVYAGEDGVVDAAPPGALFIDCSTVDVQTARAVAAHAVGRGRRMVDAPMSGGVAGAQAATLTFMVGGPDDAFMAAAPVLRDMGAHVLHAGPSGAGAAAKLCNNMMLAVQMIAVAEGFTLAARLGLSAERLFAVASVSTARCWALNDYCPAPGPVPSAPSNRGYAPGFTAALMLKDLRLAVAAAADADVAAPLGAEAAQIYALMAAAGMGGDDFSAVIRFLDGQRAAAAPL